MDKSKSQPKEKVELATQELELISRVLYANRWTGQEFQQTITPLINKLAKMIDQKK